MRNTEMMSEVKEFEEVRPGHWSRTEWGVFLTVALVLLVNVGEFGPGAGTVRNQGELAMSIVNEGNLNLDECNVDIMIRDKPICTDKASYRGHVYSGHAPGVAFLMVPVYLMLKPVLWLTQKHLGNANSLQTDYIVLTAVCGGLTAIVWAVAAVLICKWTQLMGASRSLGLTAAVACTLGSWAFYYGTQVSTKVLSAALVLFACYYCARALRRLGETPGRPNALLFLAGLLVSTAVAVDYASLLAVIALGIYVLHQGGLKAAAWYAVGTVPMSVLTGLYHTLAFGSPFVVPYAFHILSHGSPPKVTWPDLQRVYGLIVSPYKGMLFYAPWIVLAVLGCVRGLRSRFRAEFVLAGAIVLTTWTLNLSLDIWAAGGWGPRYGPMALPFLALMLAFVPRRLRWLLWVMIAFATLINLLPVLHGGIVVGEKPWDNPITLYGRAILETGAATYALRFFSRNVRELTPATLTALQALLTTVTALLVWFIWRKRTREIGTAEVR